MIVQPSASPDPEKSKWHAMLTIAHAAQDAQFGFAAVLNSIPLIVQATGSPPPAPPEAP